MQPTYRLHFWAVYLGVLMAFVILMPVVGYLCGWILVSLQLSGTAGIVTMMIV